MCGFKVDGIVRLRFEIQSNKSSKTVATAHSAVYKDHEMLNFDLE